MCSIFGIVRGGGAPVDQDVLAGMAATLSHRGPDDHGIYHASGVGIGNTRLAIVDTAGGHQPIVDPATGLVIVYNGEVYNHSDLRTELGAAGAVFRTASDTETVLAAFRAWGPACVARLNGMFAFAIWDPRDRRLFLARDRLGIKPLVMVETADGLAFASEAKALLPLIAGGPRPDWTALWRYLTFGYFSPGDDAFAGLDRFPGGHWGWVDAASSRPVLELHRFWTPEVGGGADIGADAAAARLDALLEEAVGRELMSDVPLGLFLSGGLDSSAVAYYARKRHGQGLASFALRFEEATHDESADARRVAGHLGLDHAELAFTPALVRETLRKVAATLDQPFGDSTVVPLLALSEFARQRVKVVLTGWGGDEVLAGYPTLQAHRLARYYRRLPHGLSRGLIPGVVNRLPPSDRYLSFEFKAKRFLRGMDLAPEEQHFLWMGYFDDAAKRALLAPGVIEQVRDDTLAPVRAEAARMSARDLESRILHLDTRFFLHGNGLFQADQMTMAASLEARVPLLNIDLLAFALPLPARLKMLNGQPKGLLKRVLGPHLPPEIITKPKKGFGPPSSIWIRQILPDLVQRLFARDRIESQGILNYPEVARLLAEHAARTADHGRTLWALMSMQMWYDRFILGTPSPIGEAP